MLTAAKHVSLKAVFRTPVSVPCACLAWYVSGTWHKDLLLFFENNLAKSKRLYTLHNTVLCLLSSVFFLVFFLHAFQPLDMQIVRQANDRRCGAGTQVQVRSTSCDHLIDHLIMYRSATTSVLDNPLLSS